MDTKLIVSASPHLRSEETTTGLMANVIVALTPCVVASAIIFGLRALLVTAVSVVACVAFEWLYCKLMKKANPIGDLSAVVTGIILALNVPVGMPIGELLIGDFVAIIVVKQLFGGIGMNFANPALVGRIVLFISFAGAMNKWVFPDAAVDQLSSATPLAVADPNKLSLLDLFMGVHGGVLGETCALAIVLGLIYLVVTKTISIAIPAAYVGSMFLFYLIATHSVHAALVAVLSGGLLFGGIGMNFANPALVGRIVLFISFAGSMNKWVYPDAAVDQLSSATPLAVADTSKLSLLDLFMGVHGGVLGETCALAIVLGLIYLVATKTISIAIPASYIGSMFVFYLISTGSLHGALVGILSGGLMFGAVFMATDYVTSPFTLKGKLIYGLCLGIVTFAIRQWGSYAEGVSFALLFMNLWVPFINDWTRQTPYGYVKPAKKAKEGAGK